jgi:hypothetical protein
MQTIVNVYEMNGIASFIFPLCLPFTNPMDFALRRVAVSQVLCVKTSVPPKRHLL